MILNRLMIWDDEVKVLPEAQSGFQKERGCIDNIFILISIIHLKLKKERGNVFAIFVDLKRVFDATNHNLLWNKLFQLVLCPKIVILLMIIYNKLTMKVRSNGKLSNGIEVTQGVLQGDRVLSPYLFSLFLSDIEDFFRANGALGIPITHIMELYADDLVIFVDSVTDVQRKLKILSSFCKENCKEINIKKTKIIYFHKGRTKNMNEFHFEGKMVERVQEYTYLGVMFSSSGLGIKAAKLNESKTRIAVGSVIKTCRKAKIPNMEGRLKINDAIAMSVLLYAAPIWGLRYLKIIERAQITFFKNLFSLNRNTPEWIVRLEFKAIHSPYRIMKYTL